MNKKGYELVNFCEFDKYAVKSYCAIHDVDESLNLGDITKVDIESLPQVDFITHGSPCQDFSIAGLQAGADEGTDTRSSLMWNSVEIIDHCKPKFVIWENVKNVLSKKHRYNFDKYLDKMNRLGYENYYQILNAKDYSIPQNRERIFCISIRKDIDCGFEFPLATKDIEWFNFLNMNDTRNLTNRQIRMIEFAKGLNQDDNIQIEGNINFKTSIISLRQSGLRFSSSPYIPTLCSAMGKGGGNFPILSLDYETGGLSPAQCFQLMGFSLEDFKKCCNVNMSNSKLYEQAGNSIVVNVVYEIYKQLQKYYPNDFKDLKMISLFSGIGAFEKALDKLYEEI